MFGFTRRKATAAATEATAPLIKILEIAGPLPDKFWSDPYAIGFLYMTIASFAKAATGGKIAGADLGYCLHDTFGAISGRDGVELGKRAADWALAKDPEFMQGADNALKVIAVTYGSRDLDDDPDIVEATRRADAFEDSGLGLGDRATRIASALTTLVFNERIRERLAVSQSKHPQTLKFKSGQAFFEMQCEYGHTELEVGQGVIALVLDARKEFRQDAAVKIAADGTQTAVLRVAGEHGGFIVVARTPSGRGDRLTPGDVVVWVPHTHLKEMADAFEDPRCGWVGLIRAKIAPEMNTASNSFTVLCEYD